MKEGRVNGSAVERRVALEKRRRVAEMSREEMQRELLTSEVTGLPNRRAFDEAGGALAVAMCDVDGLKALNMYGYETGNAVLKTMAEALREVGLEAYHDKGDEFLCRDTHIEQLEAKLDRAHAILRDRTIFVDWADGNTLSVRGAAFSYGVGQNLYEAELGLKSHKSRRERSGEIARGELRGVIVRTLSVVEPSQKREPTFFVTSVTPSQAAKGQDESSPVQ
jgi:GGDEF domain-containing protein